MSEGDPEADKADRRETVAVKGRFHENATIIRSALAPIVMMSGISEGKRVVIPFAALQFTDSEDESLMQAILALDNVASIVAGLSSSLEDAAEALKDQDQVFWPSAARSITWIRRAASVLESAASLLEGRDFVGQKNEETEE